MLNGREKDTKRITRSRGIEDIQRKRPRPKDFYDYDIEVPEDDDFDYEVSEDDDYDI